MKLTKLEYEEGYTDIGEESLQTAVVDLCKPYQDAGQHTEQQDIEQGGTGIVAGGLRRISIEDVAHHRVIDEDVISIYKIKAYRITDKEEGKYGLSGCPAKIQDKVEGEEIGDGHEYAHTYEYEHPVEAFLHVVKYISKERYMEQRRIQHAEYGGEPG